MFEIFDTVIRWAGGLLAYSIFGILLYGIWRGTQRKAGRSIGNMNHLLRIWWFYLASSMLFFGICYIAWIPLKWTISQQVRVLLLVFGSLLYFPGLILTLWGRLSLGKNYFVSTGLGAQLFADHQLIINGAFAIVRHPMYTGIFLAAFGALLIYTTWTSLFFVLLSPLLGIRARREEQALSAEFGGQWIEYCKRVPAFIPRLRK